MKKKDMMGLAPGDLVRLKSGYGNPRLEDRTDLLVAEVVNVRVNDVTLDSWKDRWSRRNMKDLGTYDVEPDGSCVVVRDAWVSYGYPDVRETYPADARLHLMPARDVLERFTPEVEERVRALRARDAEARKAKERARAARMREDEEARNWLRGNLPEEFHGLIHDYDRPAQITYPELRRLVEAVRATSEEEQA